jgi:hypothetical protein
MDLSLAKLARGASPCPHGTSLHSETLYCTDEEKNAFGPFSLKVTQKCLETLNNDISCHSNRWSSDLLSDLLEEIKKTPNPEPIIEPVEGNEPFRHWYRENYIDVKRNVLSWYGTTSDGCAAFATTALQMYGFDVKKETWAPTLRKNLHEKGWKHITDAALLLPGDVVFTEDPVSMQTGETGHVFIFDSYSGPRHAIALENQGSSLKRNLYRHESPHMWWFWDAYRPQK